MDLKVYALLNAKIKELTGESIDLSKYYTKEEADAAITAKVAEIVADAPEDLDTLKEMSDWISQHEDSAAAMNSAIQQNATDISTLKNNSHTHTNKTVLDEITQVQLDKITTNETNISDLESGKVDKVDGKSLISDSEITRLASVDNYDDTTIKQRVTTNETNISTLAKHINGDLLDSDFQEDSTVAMTKTVPTGMSNYAAISKIGGKTQKFNQILQHGNMVGSGFMAYAPENVNVSISGGELTVTLKTSGNGYSIGITNVVNFSILKDHIIIVKGDFNPSVNVPMGFDIGYVRNRTNCNANIYTTVYDRFLATANYSRLVTSPGNTMPIGATYKVKNIQVFDLTAMFGAGNEPTIEQFNTMFPEDYYPYTEGELWNAPVESVVSTSADGTVKTTLLIPDSDRNLPCFGYGINETVQNIRDYENGTYTQMVAEVDLGDLDWNVSSTYLNSFTASIVEIKMGERDKIGNILCDKYTANTFDIAVYEETDKTIALGTAHNVAITDKSYTDATVFKEAMKGVKLVYELETPVVTDCSDMLMPIRVEAGGTITFNNEHSLNMPNPVVYKKEVSLS